MARRRGLGVLTQSEAKAAVLEISHQLLDLDGELTRIPRVKAISGGKTSSGGVTVEHGLNKIPDDIVIVPDSNINWYVTYGDRQTWTDKTVSFQISGACQFTGFVISY